MLLYMPTLQGLAPLVDVREVEQCILGLGGTVNMKHFYDATGGNSSSSNGNSGKGELLNSQRLQLLQGWVALVAEIYLCQPAESCWCVLIVTDGDCKECNVSSQESLEAVQDYLQPDCLKVRMTGWRHSAEADRLQDRAGRHSSVNALAAWRCQGCCGRSGSPIFLQPGQG